MQDFSEKVRILQWDDHRYYHQCRINQTLHFLSAISFLVAYVYLFIDPAISALIGWLISMVTRQSGHFFFEPLGYDEINQATNEPGAPRHDEYSHGADAFRYLGQAIDLMSNASNNGIGAFKQRTRNWR